MTVSQNTGNGSIKPQCNVVRYTYRSDNLLLDPLNQRNDYNQLFVVVAVFFVTLGLQPLSQHSQGYLVFFDLQTTVAHDLDF